MTADRRVGGIHGDHHTSGAFSLGGEDRSELCPACICDAAVEPGFRGRPVGEPGSGVVGVGSRLRSFRHVFDVESFDGDGVARVDQAAGGLVVEVVAPVLGFAVEFRYLAAQVLRPATESGEAAL